MEVSIASDTRIRILSDRYILFTTFHLETEPRDLYMCSTTRREVLQKGPSPASVHKVASDTGVRWHHYALQIRDSAVSAERLTRSICAHVRVEKTSSEA